MVELEEAAPTVMAMIAPTTSRRSTATNIADRTPYVLREDPEREAPNTRPGTVGDVADGAAEGADVRRGDLGEEGLAGGADQGGTELEDALGDDHDPERWVQRLDDGAGRRDDREDAGDDEHLDGPRGGEVVDEPAAQVRAGPPRYTR